MQVELNNFRCWKKQTFNFNDKGIILINGNSGSGKSSILNAIYFAITGNGNKMVTHGEKKCSVKLTFNEEYFLKEITRTKSPSRLRVLYNDILYEDEEAQKIIDNHFGNNFQQTSYMTQKMIHSFLTLSSLEKMNFLQKFVLDNSESENNSINMKRKCKNKINELKKILIEHNSKKSLYENEFILTENKLKKIISLDINIDEYIKSISNDSYDPIIIKQLRSKQNELNIIYNQYNQYVIQENEYIKQKENLLKELNDYQLNIKEIQSKINTTEYKGDNYYQLLQEGKLYYSSQTKYTNLLNNIDLDINNCNIYIKEQLSFFNKEKNKIVDKNKNNYEELIQIHNDIDYIKNNIEKWNKSTQTIIEYYNFIKDNIYKNESINIDTINSSINLLQNNIDELKTTYTLKSEQLNKLKNDLNVNNQLHKCPNCHISLKFKISKKEPNIQKLVEYKNEPQEPETYKNKINILQEELNIINKSIEDKQREIYNLENKKIELTNYKLKLDNYKKRIVRADSVFIKYINFTFDNNSESCNSKLVQTKVNNINKWLEEYYKYLTEIENYQELIEQLNINEINFDNNCFNDYNKVSIILNNVNIIIKTNKNENVVKKYNNLYLKLNELIHLNNNKSNQTVPSISLEELDKELLTQTKLKSENEYNKQTLNTLTNKNICLKNKIEELNKKIINLTEFILLNNDIKNKYENIEKEINECYKKEQEYNHYINCLTLYNNWKRLNNEKKIQNYLYNTVSNDIVIHETLLNKINETESISLTHCIDSINYYINDYLEKFFPNDSIIVDIVPFKEKLKNSTNGKTDNSELKPVIDIKVCYKGEEVELLSLSGGEYDRVALAIMLSFNNLSKSNIVLLDESIASLDSNLTNDILVTLKENMINKYIIVVAHQLSTGIFDQIINTS
jgi:DNA repair exonuclease SbcCD ATPase subunit